MRREQSSNPVRFETKFTTHFKPQIGLYICKDALTPEQSEAIRSAFDGISDEDEDAIIKAFLKGSGAIKKVSSALTEEEMSMITEILSDPEVVENLPTFLEAVGKIDPQDTERIKVAFAKLKPENIPKIEEILGKLQVLPGVYTLSCTDVITAVSIIPRFLSSSS